MTNKGTKVYFLTENMSIKRLKKTLFDIQLGRLSDNL